MSAKPGAGIDPRCYTFASYDGRRLGRGIYQPTGASRQEMATTEHTINDSLAGLLSETRRAWRAPGVVSSENTGMIKGSSARPDILVLEPNVSPVVVETEVLAAVSVEAEAVSRLGTQIRSTGRTILSAIAVRLPVRLRTAHRGALRSELANAGDLEMAFYAGTAPSAFSRWPRSGWILGGVADLSILTQSASIPPNIIDEAATQLICGVSEAAALLEDMADAHHGAIHKISEELHQEDGGQTRRMAMTILVNAFVFHESLAGGPGELSSVRSLDELRDPGGALEKSVVLVEWRKILKINYWPIFDIARRILQLIPVGYGEALIERMAATVEKLVRNRLMRSHDLTGAVFQRLIADRKFLAAYYTTPAAAALLASLALAAGKTPSGGSWGNPADVKALRIADFACGTGTLLSTAYQRVGQLHELAGGDSETLHPDMMATALIGCDVLPAAAHLTASMLSGAHPTVEYKQGSILTVAYGKQPDESIALGSLDLLHDQKHLDILPITAKAAEGMGESEKETWSSLPHASFDVVIMNPPFTRATSHEGGKKDIPNPMFAAFSSSAEEQKLMAEATRRLTAGTSAHGNAGEASIFLVLADRKLKEGGVLALVMPLSLMLGHSWEDSRALLTRNYSNLVVVSIAGTDGADLSFSADTDMAECLVVGRKAKSKTTNRATFIILKERPTFPLLGSVAGTQIHRLIVARNIRSLEDGPVGGTLLHFGNDIIGQAIQAGLPPSGCWNLSRVSDLSLAQAAYQLANQKRVWLPGMDESEAVGIPMTTVAAIGDIGPIDRDINGINPNGSIRGPFAIRDAQPDSVPTYPALWAHDAERERAMSFAADSEAVPLKGTTAKEQASINSKALSIWGTASHCHFNRDFRFNSQSTSMQFTPRKAIGGRAWLSISLHSAELEKMLVLWANTSLGLLLYWWHANKEQPGRGSVTKSALESLAVLDVSALKPRQAAKAVKLFDEFSGRELFPLHKIDVDPGRRELDERFAREVLGLPAKLVSTGGPLEVLRMKLSREPSIRGQKRSGQAP